MGLGSHGFSSGSLSHFQALPLGLTRVVISEKQCVSVHSFKELRNLS